MTGGSRIVAFGPGTQDAAPRGDHTETGGDTPLALEESWAQPDWEPGPQDFDDAPPPRDWLAILAPTAALAVIAGWSAFFAYAWADALPAAGALREWSGLIGSWATPVLLVCTVWLLAMRSSRRETTRFGDAARLLGTEASRLETRLTTVNQELSLAREFIAAQSRDLESLGRVASERLSQHADRIAGLIHENGSRLDTIGTVSASALENMERLRGQLPVIASSAKDVTNNIGNAGRTAQVQLQELIAGFNKLNEFGQASERQVMTLRQTVDAALGEFATRIEQLDGHADARFAALAERSAELRTQLDGDEITVLAAIRTRAAALVAELDQTRSALDGHEAESLNSLRARMGAIRDEGNALGRSLRSSEEGALADWRGAIERLEADLRGAVETVSRLDEQAMASARDRLAVLSQEAEEIDHRMAERDQRFAEEIAQRQSEAETRHSALAANLAEQLAELDADIAARRTAQELQGQKLVRHAETLAGQLDGFTARMREIADHGAQAEGTIAASLAALAGQLVASREALAGTDTAIAGLTDSSVRLLELIQASVQHSTADLPQAMKVSETALAAIETRGFALRDTLTEAEQRGAALSDYVQQTGTGLAASLGQIETLHAALGRHGTDHGVVLGELQQTLRALDAHSAALADRSQGELRAAISALDTAAREAVANLETSSAAGVAAIAARLGSESAAAIDAALREATTTAAGELEAAAAHAAAASRDAAVQLRDQLTKVNELAGNLERRVTQARERAEEQVDNDFSRRVALITESLNSHAIDIARALSADVTDTAWASYLRGDRGIFTRRAVRLLDQPEAKAVAALYEGDRAFRDHVSRYIHDFEAMLRQLLSTRDGHALGVTLLSSDMGKLYVAMAQAIERLRE